MSDPTVRLTVAQAAVRFLAAQYTERDGAEQRLFAGCFGIFGHGNVAGLGQALLQSELEEIYYFEIERGPADEPGFGFHRTTSSPHGEIDVLVEVHDRDTALVPFGWHGPCVAAPGHDMYYLNVMAGPAEERAWLISDHPDQAWVRATWTDQAPDPRVEGRR